MSRSVVAVPLLTLSTWRAGAGSLRALTVATGIDGVSALQQYDVRLRHPVQPGIPCSTSRCWAWPLWTLTAQSLALWGRTSEELATDVPWWVPAYIWSVVVLNGIAWLARVLPATLVGRPHRLAGRHRREHQPGDRAGPGVLASGDGLAWLGGLEGPPAGSRPGRGGPGVLGPWSPSAWRSTSGGATGPTLPRPGHRPVRSCCSQPWHWSACCPRSGCSAPCPTALACPTVRKGT